VKVSYYPGCSLDGTAREYDESLRAVAGTLGIELAELPGWTCCGASSAHATDDALAFSLSAANLVIAGKMERDVVVPCAACYQRLKKAEKDIQAGRKTGGASPIWSGKWRIRHAADFFREDVGEPALAARVKKPLTGLRPVCYYGCLTTRPPKVTDAARPEDPRSLDDIMSLLGADVQGWSFKTDCCGGNLMFTHPELAKKLVRKLYDMALEAGADCFVVGCPLCQSNLDARQRDIKREDGTGYGIPVYYFTELMGLAFGEPGVKKWLGRHITDAKSLLHKKGLLD
jgi:heterodisulfide reductase subunit B